MSFAEVLRAAQPQADGFRVAVPDDWGQGRTAYGGFSTALAYQAAVQAGGKGLPPLRSVVVSFVGPLYGDLTVTARVLRRGRNATWIAAEVLRGDEVGLTASFVFMGPVASSLSYSDIPVPAGVIAPELLEDVPLDDYLPVFRQHYDFREAIPPEQRRANELCNWVRLREPEGFDAMAQMLLIADALQPGMMALIPATAPVSSMTWQVNLLTAAPATRDGWWLLRSSGDHAEAGSSSQAMHVWNSAGEPVSSGMQAIAVFG